MRRLLCLTGTDTGVGKTHVTRGIVRVLREREIPAAPLKLVETGCTRHGAELLGDDGVVLARAAGVPLEFVAPFRFELPAAPQTAAEAAGRQLSFAELIDQVELALKRTPRIVLEGAGGLLVPVSREGTFGDLLARLDGGLVIVARDQLGTLNHTLLTVEAAERRGLHVVGVILNAVSAEPCSLDHRSALLAARPDIPCFGPMPWAPQADDTTLARHVLEAGFDPGAWFTGENQS